MASRQNTIIATIIWLFVTLFYCYQYILRLLPNVIMPELMKQFSVGAVEFGNFAGIYYIGYVLMQIPFGLLFSRFGGKYVMPISIIITAIGLLPIANSDSWQLVMVGRFLIGIGASAAIVGAFQIFRIIFPEHFSRVLGAFVCVGILTAVYIAKPLSSIINDIGIKITVNSLSLSGIILAIATYIILPKMPVSRTANVWKDIKAVMGNKKIIIISLLAGLMVGPMEGFADAWGTAFFRVVYGIDRYLADDIVAKVLIGMCAGSLILPYIAEKTKSYYGTSLASGVIMGICFILFLNTIGGALALYMACIVIGVFSAYQVVIIPYIASFAAPQLSGMAAAVSNMIIMSFGYLFHSLIARTVENSSEAVIIDGVPSYSYDSYIYGISLIPGAIIIAVIGFAIAIRLEKNKGRHPEAQLSSKRNKR